MGCPDNSFNALCSTLMAIKNRQIFVEAEGVELMVLILKQKKPVRFGALKALVSGCCMAASPHAENSGCSYRSACGWRAT